MLDHARQMRLKTALSPVASLDDLFEQRKEVELAGALVRAVHKSYPGYVWGVEVNFKGGVATLKLPYLMQASHCFCIHLTSVTSFPEMVKVMKHAGGELLERFKLDRAGLDSAQFQDVEKTSTLISPKQAMPE